MTRVPYDELLVRLREKKKSYQSLKGLLESDALMDLAWFCHAFQTTAGEDQQVLEGRRQVWLRICEYLHFEPDELAQLYGAAIRKGNF